MPRYRISVGENRWRVYHVDAETPKEALGRLLDAMNGVMGDQDQADSILSCVEDSDCIDVRPFDTWEITEEIPEHGKRNSG